MGVVCALLMQSRSGDMAITSTSFLLALALLALSTLSSAVLESDSFEDVDRIVPDSGLSQAYEGTSDLETQFDRLQSQMQAGAEITPAVKKTVLDMLKLIPDLTKAITEANTAEQSELNEEAKVIKAANTNGQEVRKSLLQSAKTYQDAIGRFNTFAGDLTTEAKSHVSAVTRYEKAVSAKTTECCERDQRKQTDSIIYTSPYAECDFAKSTVQQCEAAAVADVQAKVSKFQAAHKLYTIKATRCTSSTARVKSLKLDVVKAKAVCNNMIGKLVAIRAGLSSGKHANRKADRFNGLNMLKQQWATDEKTFHKQFGDASKGFKAKASRIQVTAANRQKEFASTKLIECMLKKFADGGNKLDSEATKECKDNLKPNPNLVLKMPRVPKAIVWKAPEFKPLLDISKDENKCFQTAKAMKGAKCTVTPPRKPTCS